jgi:transcriptional regulator with XRE-family HTH domain
VRVLVSRNGDHNGQRLARARLRRRWTQERLARDSGFSLATVRAIEQGRRSLDNMGQLLTFARALEIPVTDLTGQPYAPSSPDQDAGQGAVAGIRRELLLAGREPRISDTQAAAVSLPALRDRVGEMSSRHRSAALASMGHDLPSLLRDLRIARHAASAAQRAAVYGLLAQAYEAAMDMLKQTGYEADATAAIERARWAAQHSGDRLRALTVEWHYSGEFIRVGELADAAEIIESGLEELRPSGRENVTAAALTGAYELKAALIAARAGDRATTWQRWERARAVAEEIGRDLNEPLAFGPSNVAIWSVALPVEMFHGTEAVSRARMVNPVLSALIPAATIGPGRYSRERLSRHWIDVGRAYHYRADRDRALAAILQAERIAPHKTRINPAAREVISHLLRSRRKNDLVELALRMGVA